MINNRQSSSRRRGRGGSNQRTSGGGSGQRDSGNRIDSRARGNAAQLLEKYKNMARDAQMQGDRVNTEYYLQFADHYFRVLSDGRARTDDQRPPAQTNGFDGFDSNGDEEYGDEGEPIRANEMTPRDDGNRDNPRRDDGRRDDGRNDSQRRDYAPRDDYRRDTQGRGDQNRDAQPRDGNQTYARDDGRNEPRPVQAASNGHAAYRNGTANEEREAAPEAVAKPERKPSRSRSKSAAPASEDSPAFDAALLPPSLNVATDEATEEKPKRRRGRPPASEATQPN